MRPGSEHPPPDLFDGTSFFVKFPLFPIDQIKKIQMQIQQERDKFKVLNDNGYVPHYDAKILEKIVNNQNNYYKFHMYIISYVLNSYISWQFIHSIQQQIDEMHYLLNALLLIMKFTDQTTPSFIPAAATAFYNLYSSYISTPNLPNFRIYLDILRDYYTSNIREFPLYSYEMLSETLKAAFHNGLQVKDDDVSLLLVVIGILCEEHARTFPPNVAQTIASLLTNDFANLDITTLSVYSHLSNYMSPGSLHKTISVLPQAIIDYSTKLLEKHSFPIERGNHQILSSLKVNESFFTVNPIPTFVSGLNMRPNITFPEKANFEELFPNEFHARLLLLLSTASKYPNIEETLMVPLEQFILSNHDHSSIPYLCFAILYFAMQVFSRINVENLIECLLTTPVLDGNLTIFDNIADFSVIDVLRNMFIELIIRNDLYLSQSFLDLTQKPALFAEIVYRIIRDSDTIHYNNIQPFVRFIMTSSLYYQSQHYQFGDTEDIIRARTALLLLVSHVLAKENVASSFFNNSYFFTFYLSFIFEDALRPTVLSSLLTFLSSPNNEFPDALFMMLAQSLQICFTNFPDPRYLTITYDVLQILNEVLKHRRSSTQTFANIRQSFFPSMAKLDQSDISKLVLLQYIQYFALTSSVELLDQEELSELDSTIKGVFPGQFEKPLWIKLIQLIATDITPSINPSFKVRQGEAVKLFLSIASSTNKYMEAIDYIDSLINYSTGNVFRSLESGLDLWVIDKLKSDLEAPKDITAALLKLFTNISSIASSTTAVQRFISLFAPIEGRYIPTHQEMYLDTLNNIISTALVRPRTYLKIDDQTFINVNGIGGAELENGFSFCAWVWVDDAPSQYRPNLLTLTDSKNRKIVFFISAASLFVQIRTETTESHGKVEMDDIPRRQWVFIVMSVGEEDGCTIVDTFINGKMMEPLEFPPMKPFTLGVSTKIGGLIGDPYQTNAPVRISAFGLFPRLEQSSISILYDMGVRVVGEFPTRPQFFHILNVDNTKIVLNHIHDEPNVKSTLNSNNIRWVLSFTDILIMYCKVEMLIPLFAQLDMTTQSGENIKGLSKFIVQMLGKIFSLSPMAQSSFHWGNGFAIIAHLLLSTDRRHIRYSLYKQFFAITQYIFHPFLQQEIFREIILNNDIWIRCDPQGLLQVIKHWVRVVLPSFKQIVAEVLTFRRILSILRLYYWYEPVERPQILAVDIRLSDDYNIEECRRNLQFIALTNSATNFTSEDFTCLQSHCITCTEDKQVADNLWMLLQLGSAHPSPLEKIKGDFTSFLFTLMSRGCETILTLIMKIIIEFDRNGVRSNSSVYEQVGFIIQLFPPSMMKPSMLEKLIRYIKNGMVELLPIAFVVAHQSKLLDRLLTEIVPSEVFTRHVSWALWPLYVCTLTTDANVIKILRFLVLCSSNSWEIIYGTIDLISTVLNENFSEMKANLLNCILEAIKGMEYPAAKTISTFFRLSKFFLFYRDPREGNDALSNLIKTSPFRSFMMPARSPSELASSKKTANSPIRMEMMPLTRAGSSIDFKIKEIKQFSKVTFKADAVKASDFVLKLGKCIEPIWNYYFGLRFDATEDWIDKEFALEVSSMFSKYAIRDFVGFDIILSSVLVHFYKEKTVDHIRFIALSEEERVQYLPHIYYLNYNLKKCGCKLIKDFPEERMYENAFICLQRVQDMDIIMLEKKLFSAIKSFTEGNSKKFVDSLAVQSDELVGESLMDIGVELDGVIYHRLKNSRKWSTLWRYLAVDRAPWNYQSDSHSHFKRDNTACVDFIPVKLKRNLRFDPHSKNIPRSGSQPIKLMEISAKPVDDIDTAMAPSEKSANKIVDVPCKVIAPQQERDAQFVLTKEHMKLLFVTKKKFINLNSITHIFFRRRYHKPNSIEVFLNTGKTYFIYFPNNNSLQILQRFSDLSLPSIKTLQTKDFYSFFQQSKMKSMWLSGKISNFTYLMHLNQMSGRTFNDLSQYPIMPWILAKYDPELHQEDNSLYRDLTKVIGQIGEERYEELHQRIPEMIASGEAPYLYGSGSSAVLSVCLFLVRLEPFATLHIYLQKGQFDHPARLFSSIADTYHQVTHNLNDYRELIPEFFCMPEFLINHNSFDLGSTSANGKIGDVILPGWAQSAMEFVYMHRKLLESEFVTSHLHRWIDNIWGIGQKTDGNLFRPEMYDTIWEDEQSSMTLERAKEIEEIMENVGQIPPQLFREPHPPRMDLGCPNALSTVFEIKSNQAMDVVMTRFDKSHDGLTGKITVVEANGLIVACAVDFGKLLRSHHPPRRMSMRSKASQQPQPQPQPPKAQGASLEEVTVINADEISFSMRSVPGFADLRIKGGGMMTVELPRGHFAAISKTTGRVVCVDAVTGRTEELTALHNEAICIASDKDYLVVSLQDSALCIFRNLKFDKPAVVMPSYRDSIVCCALSADFYLAVLGTQDGTLVVNSLKGGTVRVVDLQGCRPRAIRVTPGWGLIVVYMTKNVAGHASHIVSVYTVNGDFVRSASLEARIVAWDAWVSPRGFDYIVYADDRGRLYAFEVFTLAFSPPFFRCRGEIADVHYVSDISATVAIARDGRILFVPTTVK